jgi:hypothetical protein
MLQAQTYRTARFGRGATILRAKGMEPLALDLIEKAAPAVFAEDKHESRSERYAYIPTRDVMQGMWDQGFRPFEVRQGGSSDETKRAHTKHMVRFRQVDNSGAMIAHTDRVFPEVILLNSHDGTSAYRLDAGLFRLVCTNGMVCGDVFESIRIPHKGDVIDKVIEGAFRVVEEFPEVLDNAESMAALRLSGPEQIALARAAAELRWEPEDNGTQTAPIEAAQLLATRRREDVGGDLWRTMNRLQEGLIRGGQAYEQRNAEGRRVARRHVRPVQNIDQNRTLNRALWTLAEEMRRLKA